jgi:ribosomal protection tetracycline resistance protein
VWWRPWIGCTIGIVAHIDAGKTTLTERILFDTGAQTWVGERRRWHGDHGLDAGGTQSRHLDHRGRDASTGEHVLQVVDTPGHVDSRGRGGTLSARAHGVVVLVDAVRGASNRRRKPSRQQAGAKGPPRPRVREQARSRRPTSRKS